MNEQNRIVLDTILSMIVTIVINPKKGPEKDWDVSIVFSDLLYPKLFDIFAEAGVQATVYSGTNGSVINSKPFFLVTRKMDGNRVNCSFSTTVKIGKGDRTISSIVPIALGDKIRFSFHGISLREFQIKPEFDLPDEQERG